LVAQVTHIEQQRQLLEEPDPVTPLVASLTQLLRDELNRLHTDYQTRHKNGMARLDADTNWKQLEPEQRNSLLATQKLTLTDAPKVQVANTDEVLATVDRLSLSSFADRVAAIDSRFDAVLVAAAELMEPKAQFVKLPSRTIKTDEDIEAWLRMPSRPSHRPCKKARSSFTEVRLPMMQALDKDLRGALEKTVKAARTVAETAAHAAVDQLGVGHDKPEAFLSDAEKALRNRLRTHGKQLGDARDSKSTNPTYGKQEVQHLVQEVAYQHWHRMLFARFLADNNLLMYDGVAVTIEECDELAPDEGAKSGWELAGKLAARMLPQVFKPGSPVFELTFAPEHQSELERLLKDLPDAVFKASDSLGWVYQFWQADNKERINKSEVKIGADELPAVTQLFTEPYMVAFLLHNSLGAWWATRHPGKPCPVNLDYFRTLEDGTPAAGKFEGWPDSLADFKLLDPCCGSGHFLVAAFLMLVPMRMAAEGLSAKEAVNRVLAENIHGLELDPRCVEIAVFAVALEAWRYPDASASRSACGRFRHPTSRAVG
jgi:hypothetical protein